ncbi:MAG: hypothetical protein LBJ70_04610 [Holosporales bacterium]|nr:hypothetical protein [Holosporales bacterium]
MPTVTSPSFLDHALLLRQATPFHGWTQGKSDTAAALAFSQCVAPKEGDAHSKFLMQKAADAPLAGSQQEGDQVAVELVGLLFGTMLNAVFAGLNMGEGSDGEIWKSMLVEQYGKLLAESPVGEDLRKTICAQISRQEKQGRKGT